MRLDNIGESIDLERFGQIIVRASGHQPINLRLGRVRAEDDHWNSRSARVGFQSGQDLRAAEIREMDIEQDKVGLMPQRQFEAERTLHGADQLDGRIFAEQMLDESKIGDVVCDVEQGFALAVETGKWRGPFALRAERTA